MREHGYYWVKFKDDPTNWVIGLYIDGAAIPWVVDRQLYYETALLAVGPIILPPD